MKLQRACSNVQCRKKFTCNGECEKEDKIELETTCFCPECARKAREDNPDFYFPHELCVSRFGDKQK